MAVDSLTKYDSRIVDGVRKLVDVRLANMLDLTYMPVIIETGTYRGMGTTRMLIEATSGFDPNVPIHTIEAHWGNFCIAKTNLMKYSWVNVIYGLSVGKDEALNAIRDNDVLHHQHEYAKVGINIDTPDPIPFYESEIMGTVSAWGDIGDIDKRQENVLEKLIGAFGDTNPIFALDSCGGIGWFEFSRVCELMDNRPFSVWLHDVAHVKHFRSYDHIKHNPQFEVNAEDPGEWVLATYLSI